MINRDQYLSSNHYIFDMFSNNKSFHFFTNLLETKSSENYNLLSRITNVDKLAESFLEAINSFKNGSLYPTNVDRKNKSLSPFLICDDSIGEKISHSAVATQSSTYDIDEGKSREAQGVLSGKLTGSYQCHTKFEQNPWIKIDLGV